MRRFRPGAIIFLVVIATIGAAYDDETEFIGTLVRFNDQGISKCDFVYRTPIGREVRVSAGKFCEMNRDVVQLLNERAEIFLRENPINDPEEVARQERLIRELRQDGYRVEKEN
jgi:hypothetical protein